MHPALRAGLRGEGRHEVHLRERMLRGERRRQGGVGQSLPAKKAVKAGQKKGKKKGKKASKKPMKK
jgi:hypothetical protein